MTAKKHANDMDDVIILPSFKLLFDPAKEFVFKKLSRNNQAK